MEAIKSKIVLVGSIATGKSALIARLIQNEFVVCPSTTGAIYYKHIVHIDDQDVILNIWDTAGQERFRAVSKMYYRSANVFLLVFDLDRPDSLEDADEWARLIRENCVEEKYDILLVGNKIDIAGASSHIKLAEEKARKIRADIMLTSCRTGQGVKELFEAAAKRSLGQGQKTAQSQERYIETKPDTPSQQKKGCC